MKKISLILSFTVACLSTLQAQLVVDNTMTVEQLVQDVLLGQNVSVSNITVNGAAANTVNIQVGSFDVGADGCNMPIESGFLMSSGGVAGAPGPNDQSGGTAASNGLSNGSDSDLLTLVTAGGGSSIHDWVIIEFDFVPLGDTLQFNYVFASEEYPEYVSTGQTPYNDFFGFFLSGPGISGSFLNNAINIALIPGTNIPVGIGTLNNGSANTGPCEYCEYYNQDIDWGNPDDDLTTNPFYMQYDGYTDILTAIGIVQCGQTYHIKLAISDSGDGVLDSCVFLERDSFSSNLVVQVDIDFEVGGPDDNTLFEDCGTAEIVFTRPESNDINTPLTAYIEYGGTADELIDYTDLPDSVYFPPGVMSVSFPLSATVDGISEGTETVEMLITNFAQCNEYPLESEFEFYIDDTADPIVIPDQIISICDGGTAIIEPEILGGYGAYNFNWSTGESTETITVSPLLSTTYTLTVSDTCGIASADGDFEVQVAEFPPLTVDISPDPAEILCWGTNLMATANGGDLDYSGWMWTDAMGNNLWGWQNSLWMSTWNFSDTVYVSVTDGCGEIATDVVYPYSDSPPLVVDIPTSFSAPCGSQLTLDPDITGGSEPYYVYWYDANWWWLGQADTWTITVNGNTTINMQVSDNCGSFYSATINITAESIPIIITLPAQLTGSCTDEFDIEPVITGGSGVYTYDWSGTDGFSSSSANIVYQSNTTQTLTLEVSDNCFSTSTASMDIIIVNVPPVLQLSGDVTATCIDDVDFTATVVSGGEPDFGFEWSVDGDIIATSDIATWQSDETVQLSCTVTDACDLSDTETAFLIIDNPSLGIDVTPDSSICRGSQIVLHANGIGGVGALSYLWAEPDGDLIAGSSLQVSPGSDAVYYATVYDQCAQEMTDWIILDVQFVDAAFTADYLTDVDVQYQALSADSCGDCVYTWDFGDGTSSLETAPFHSYSGMDQFLTSLTVTNDLGCTDVEYSTIYPPVDLFIPNAFTPDGDGINDVLQFHGMGIAEFNVSIFDRWGEIVYQSDNIDKAWTGNFQNGDYFAPNGVYIILVKYKGVNTDAQEFSGSITLIR